MPPREPPPPHFRSIVPFLATRDLAQTIAFYTNLLGFRIATAHPPEAPTFVILDWMAKNEDPVRASLIFDSTCWQDEPKMTGQLWFDLGSDVECGSTVLSLHERLRSVVTVEWGPEVYAYGRREFSFKDPNGYSIVLSEETSAPPTCDG